MLSSVEPRVITHDSVFRRAIGQSSAAKPYTKAEEYAHLQTKPCTRVRTVVQGTPNIHAPTLNAVDMVMQLHAHSGYREKLIAHIYAQFHAKVHAHLCINTQIGARKQEMLHRPGQARTQSFAETETLTKDVVYARAAPRKHTQRVAQ